MTREQQLQAYDRNHPASLDEAEEVLRRGMRLTIERGDMIYDPLADRFMVTETGRERIKHIT